VKSGSAHLAVCMLCITSALSYYEKESSVFLHCPLSVFTFMSHSAIVAMFFKRGVSLFSLFFVLCDCAVCLRFIKSWCISFHALLFDRRRAFMSGASVSHHILGSVCFFVEQLCMMISFATNSITANCVSAYQFLFFCQASGTSFVVFL
jgi:hypothetical protein